MSVQLNSRCANYEFCQEEKVEMSSYFEVIVLCCPTGRLGQSILRGVKFEICF